MKIDDMLRDLMRVGSIVMHIEKFQVVFRVVVVGFRAIQENDVSLPRLPAFPTVFNIEDTPSDINDQERRVGISFHIVARGAEIATAPGRVEIELSGNIRGCK